MFLSSIWLVGPALLHRTTNNPTYRMQLYRDNLKTLGSVFIFN